MNTDSSVYTTMHIMQGDDDHNNDNTTTNNDNDNIDGNNAVALCASCDRCRSRKTKCDGKRPCTNCATKYMKKNKLTRYVLRIVLA